jgi:acyl carrier protein
MQDDLEKIAAIIRDLFDEYEGPVTRDLSAGGIAQWDSLTHVQFVVLVEQALRVRFHAREVAQFKNIGELLDMAALKRGAR